MKFVPFGNKVLIDPEKVPEKSAGGIILSAAHTEKPNQGRVVAVGAGKFSGFHGFDAPPYKPFVLREPMESAEGDTVIYSKYEGVNIPIDGNHYLCLPESAIHGKLVSD